MKYKTIAIVTMLLSAQAFANSRSNPKNSANTVNDGMHNDIGARTDVNVRNDNTKINARDMDQKKLTADQQKNSKTDTRITSRIRQDIMNQKNFSTYAKNVKIITVNGKVTLKGPVRSEREKNEIMNFARQSAGQMNVSNEMTLVKVEE